MSDREREDSYEGTSPCDVGPMLSGVSAVPCVVFLCSSAQSIRGARIEQ
jgi:hypothetical protein